MMGAGKTRRDFSTHRLSFHSSSTSQLSPPKMLACFALQNLRVDYYLPPPPWGTPREIFFLARGSGLGVGISPAFPKSGLFFGRDDGFAL